MADLTLTPISPAAPGGCGCGCGSSSVADDSAPVGGVATYPVSGMTCGGCVNRVTRAVEKLPGVNGVRVDLVRGGVSTVAVTGEASPGDVRRALAEAGYPVIE